MKIQMTGTSSQVEWATLIRGRVSDEFERVAKAFAEVAQGQSEGLRSETQAVIEILHEKRAEVMTNEQAGYFIHQWQELDGKVRQAIADDPRYQAIRNNRESRKRKRSMVCATREED